MNVSSFIHFGCKNIEPLYSVASFILSSVLSVQSRGISRFSSHKIYSYSSNLIPMAIKKIEKNLSYSLCVCICFKFCWIFEMSLIFCFTLECCRKKTSLSFLDIQIMVSLIVMTASLIATAISTCWITTYSWKSLFTIISGNSSKNLAIVGIQI